MQNKMKGIEEVKGYECPDCGEIFEEEHEAIDCCSENREVEEIDRYECTICKNWFETQKDAINCYMDCLKKED